MSSSCITASDMVEPTVLPSDTVQAFLRTSSNMVWCKSQVTEDEFMRRSENKEVRGVIMPPLSTLQTVERVEVRNADIDQPLTVSEMLVHKVKI